MKLNKNTMSKHAKCGSVVFNNFLMGITNLDDLETLLVFMLKHSHKTRIDRVYGRYSMVRKQQEREMLSTGRWC